MRVREDASAGCEIIYMEMRAGGGITAARDEEAPASINATGSYRLWYGVSGGGIVRQSVGYKRYSSQTDRCVFQE